MSIAESPTDTAVAEAVKQVNTLHETPCILFEPVV